MREFWHGTGRVPAGYPADRPWLLRLTLRDNGSSYSSSVSEPGSKLIANGWLTVSTRPARISASRT